MNALLVKLVGLRIVFQAMFITIHANFSSIIRVASLRSSVWGFLRMERLSE
jgi:hypothetical protein